MRSEIEPNFLPLTQQEISEVSPLENLLLNTVLAELGTAIMILEKRLRVRFEAFQT